MTNSVFRKSLVIGIIILLVGASIVSSISVDIKSKESEENDTALLNRGLVGYWSFNDGTANDNSGNGHHGTLYGPTSVLGICEQAFHFEPGDYIHFGNLDSDLYTCISWIKPDYNITKNSGAPGGGNSIFYMCFTNIYENIGLGDCTSLVQDETISIHGFTGGEWRTAVIDQDITNDTFHMIAIRWNSSLDRYDIFFNNVKN